MRLPRASAKWVATFALLPAVAVGIFAAVALLQRAGRFDERYFTLDYETDYSGPGAVILALVDSVRSGDSSIQAELQGRSDPSDVPTVPDLEIGALVMNGPVYVTYQTYSPSRDEVFVFNTEQVGERWVYAPRDAFLYFNSGLWVPHALRVTAACWTVAALLAIVLLLRRLRARGAKQPAGAVRAT